MFLVFILIKTTQLPILNAFIKAYYISYKICRHFNYEVEKSKNY